MADRLMGAVHTIDPHPDTVIFLEDPCTEFASWDDGTTSPISPRFGKGGELERSRTFSRAWLSRRESRRLGVSDDDAPGRITHRRHDSLFGGGDAEGRSSGETTLVDLGGTEMSDCNVHELRELSERKANVVEYHVSSRHLMLASPWFRRALSNKSWAEADHDGNGRFCIRTSGWDTEALLVLLNVLHLQNRQVPRIASLELLAKIGVLVDYYECSEAIEIFAELWTKKLQDVFPPIILCRDLVLWIWVSWQFRMEQHFELATAAAVKQSCEDFDSLDLPIPPSVTEAIDTARISAIEKVVTGLRGLLERYRSLDYSCPVANAHSSFECGSILFGALTKGLDTTGILDSDASYEDWSFESICTALLNMKSPTWFYSGSSGYYQSKHMCNFKGPVKEIVDDVRRSIQGLRLEDVTGIRQLTEEKGTGNVDKCA